MKNSTVGFSTNVGLFRARSVHDDDFIHGTEIALGSSVTAHHGLFFLNGLTQTDLRIFGDHGLAWSFMTQTGRAGIALGPIEFASRLGLALLTVDSIRGNFSVEMFSPRVGVDVGLHLGPVHIEAGAVSEVLWRWMGSTYHVQGLFVGLRIEEKPKIPFEKSGDPLPTLPTPAFLP